MYGDPGHMQRLLLIPGNQQSAMHIDAQLVLASFCQRAYAEGGMGEQKQKL